MALSLTLVQPVSQFSLRDCGPKVRWEPKQSEASMSSLPF